MNSQIINHTQNNHSQVAGAHDPSNLSGPPKRSASAPLGRNSASLEGYTAIPPRLRLARGLDAPSGETSPRSRAGRPLWWDSASLEGRTPPRVGFRLARGSRGLAAPAPTPPTGAFNVLTQCRRPSQGRILAMALTPPGNHISALFRQPSR
jgi:hypothetical protein